MSEFRKTDLILDKKYDPTRKRHYLNNELIVLHCHHYSTLYTQLAIDAGETALLSEVAENSFYKILIDYFEDKNITSLEDKIEIACQYFAAVGLGKMQVNNISDYSGEVELIHSHVDKGWITKWGNYDKPVNYISGGYIAAMFSAITGDPKGTFKTMEVKSIVKGDNTSIFKIFI